RPVCRLQKAACPPEPNQKWPQPTHSFWLTPQGFLRSGCSPSSPPPARDCFGRPPSRPPLPSSSASPPPASLSDPPPCPIARPGGGCVPATVRRRPRPPVAAAAVAIPPAWPARGHTRCDPRRCAQPNHRNNVPVPPGCAVKPTTPLGGKTTGFPPR